MTKDKKQSLHNKAKRFNELSGVFLRITDGINKVLAGCEDVIFEPKGNNIYYGFGQLISFSWKFILVDDLPYGALMVNHIKEDIPTPFFVRYFDPKGNVYSKLGQASSEYCPEKHDQMENMLFLILEDFYKLDCFKE